MGRCAFSIRTIKHMMDGVDGEVMCILVSLKDQVVLN